MPEENEMLMQIILCLSCFLVVSANDGFPLYEFLATSSINVSESSDFMMGAELFYLCGGEWAGEKKCCECDDDCFRKRSCCIDKLWDPLRPIPLSEYMELFRNETLQRLQTECQAVQPYASYPNFKVMFQESNFREGYEMVSSCKSESSTFTSKCNNDEKLPEFDRLPVISANDSANDYLIYKNKYCALCNDIKSFRNLNITINCGNEIVTTTTTTTPSPTTPPPTTVSNQSSVLNDINRFRDCLVSINPSMEHAPHQRLKKCSITKRLKQNCEDTTSFCHLYQGVFDGYKNIHCHQCNGEMFDPKKLDICLRPFERSFTWRTTISFLRDKTSVEVNDNGQLSKQQERCSYGEIYNLFKDNCEKFACVPGYVFKNNICVADEKETKKSNNVGEGFVSCLTTRPVYLYLVLKSKLQQTGLSSLTVPLQERFNFTLLQSHEVGKELSILKSRYIISGWKNESSIQDILNNFDFPSIWTNVSEVYLSSSDIVEITSLYGFDPSRYFSSHRLCSFKHDVNMSTDGTNLTDICQQSNKTNELSFMIRINQTSHNIATTNCSMFHLHSSCPVIEINKIKISQHLKNASFFHKGKHFLFDPTQYRPTLNNGSIAVCAIEADHKQQNEYKWKEDFEDIEYKLIIVLEGISIFFGVIFLITHMFFKELRNRGGIFFMCLATSILMTDCLFFLCTTNYKVSAILLHLSLLFVNVWSAVLVIDLCFTFTSKEMKNVADTPSTKQIFRKAVLVSLVPFLVVGACVTLDETKTIQFGYGENSVCWMSQYYPRLAAYTIPSLVTYVASFMCLIFLLHHLQKRNADSKITLQSSGHADISIVRIALKLVIILGIVEILGFIQISKTTLTENETKVNVIFGFLYNVTKSLRNTLFFFAVLFNKRTQKLYKKKMHRGGGGTEMNINSTPLSTHKVKTQSTLDSVENKIPG